MTTKSKKSPPPSVKKKKKPATVLDDLSHPHCEQCENGTRVPDTFTFRAISVTQSERLPSLAVECWYCKQWMSWGIVERLLGVTIRSQAMAQKANGKPS